jgi:thioredoxin 1
MRLTGSLKVNLGFNVRFDMAGGCEGFICGEDRELKSIREAKRRRLLKEWEEKRKTGIEPVHVTDLNFNKVISENPLVLIDFWAAWCMPCKMIAPIIEDLAREYSGKVLVGKLNVDENPSSAERFQVFSIPTLLIMKNGREVDRIVGFVPKNHIESRLKKHLE